MGGCRPFEMESHNGLEDPEDRRSVGWHGNQHVCLRRPQVSGSASFTLDAGGPPGVARSRTGSVPVLVSTFETSVVLKAL